MARRKDTPAPPTVGIPGGDDPPDRPVELPDRGPATPNAEPPERVRVDADTLIQRPDLGPGATTFVAAGDQIPVGLEDFARAPA